MEVRAIEVWTRAAGATGGDEPGRVTPLPIRCRSAMPQ